MLFFPYKLDADLYRVPFLTVLVCLTCVFVFVQQLSADSDYGQRIVQHCRSGIDPNLQAIFAQVSVDGERGGCVTTHRDRMRDLAAEMPH